MLAILHALLEEMEDQLTPATTPKEQGHTSERLRKADIEGFHQQKISRADSRQLHNQGRGTAVLAHLASSSLGARKELT